MRLDSDQAETTAAHAIPDRDAMVESAANHRVNPMIHRVDSANGLVLRSEWS